MSQIAGTTVLTTVQRFVLVTSSTSGFKNYCLMPDMFGYSCACDLRPLHLKKFPLFYDLLSVTPFLYFQYKYPFILEPPSI